MQGDSHLDGGPEPVDVAERQLTIVELTEASKDGRLMEAFVTGTAVSRSKTKMPPKYIYAKGKTNGYGYGLIAVLHCPSAGNTAW